MVAEFILISAYIFFRYIRANKTLWAFVVGLFFTGLAIYEARNNILLFVILLLWAGLSVFIAYFKESGNEWIKKLQKNYKPSEHILHAIGFVVIAFLVFLIKERIFR